MFQKIASVIFKRFLHIFFSYESFLMQNNITAHKSGFEIKALSPLELLHPASVVAADLNHIFLLTEKRRHKN